MKLEKERIISTIMDQVYEVLKENIVNGTLEPGQRIQELQIAKELNVSRSPVRSAITRLIGEGLLESVPNKSVCVRRLGERDIIEAYEFRLIVEQYAVTKVIERCNDEIKSRLSQFRIAFKTYSNIDQLGEYMRVDSEFHEYIVVVSGNKVIKEALDKVSMLINPFRVFALSSPNRFYDSIDEHIDIVDAILRLDSKAAVELCSRHLTLAKEAILRHLKEKKEPASISS
jgi:DNA-binding GntR family transcriptional regulator